MSKNSKSENMICAICGFSFIEGDKMIYHYINDAGDYFPVHEACSLRDDLQELDAHLGFMDTQIEEARKQKAELISQVLRLTNRTQEQAREIQILKRENDGLTNRQVIKDLVNPVTEDGLVH